MRTLTLLLPLVAVLLAGSQAPAPACAEASSFAKASEDKSADRQDPLKVDDPPVCTDCKKETYGTTVQWEGSPAEAAKKAKEQKKLVFVLHVSGLFEDPKFT